MITMTDDSADQMRARMRAVGILDHEWPDGAAGRGNGDVRNRLLDWATDGGWVLDRPKRRCLHWVAGQRRRCAALWEPAHEGSLMNFELFDALDHATFWRKAGRPALLLAQPYVLDQDVLNRIADTWGFSVVTFEDNPWYGRGTYSVFITDGGV